jgi:hypothetical protein
LVTATAAGITLLTREALEAISKFAAEQEKERASKF